MLLKEIKEAEANGIYTLIVNVALRSIGSEIRFIPRIWGHLSKHELNQAARFTGLQSHLSTAVYFFRLQSVFLNLKLVYPPSGAVCKSFKKVSSENTHISHIHKANLGKLTVAVQHLCN